MSVTGPIVTGDIALTLRWGILAGWILVSLLASVAAARLAARHHLQAADRRWSVLALAGTALFTLGLAGTQLTINTTAPNLPFTVGSGLIMAGQLVALAGLGWATVRPWAQA